MKGIKAITFFEEDREPTPDNPNNIISIMVDEKLANYINRLEQKIEKLSKGYCDIKEKCNNGDCDCTNEEYNSMCEENVRLINILNDLEELLNTLILESDNKHERLTAQIILMNLKKLEEER